LRRRFWIINALGLLGLGGLYILFRTYDVEFLDFVVAHTVMEKLAPEMDAAAVQARFDELRAMHADGRLGRPGYRQFLLDTAAFVEKNESLHAPEVGRIFDYMEQARAR
jgi:hypothetical protein